MQNYHLGNLKTDKGNALADRFLNFTVRIIKLVKSLPNTIVGKHNHSVLNHLFRNLKNYVQLLQEVLLQQKLKNRYIESMNFINLT